MQQPIDGTRAPAGRARPANRVAARLAAAGARAARVALAVLLAACLGMPQANLSVAGAQLAGAQAAFAVDGAGGDAGTLSTPGAGSSDGGADDPVVNVSVPYVGGMDITSAKNAIVAAGLKYRIEGDTSADAVVVSQDPAYGKVPAGTVVVLTCEAPAVPTLESMTIGYVDTDTNVYIAYPDVDAGQVPAIKAKGGKIQLLSSVKWTSGTIGYASDQGVPITWTSDNPDIATVDATEGIVTAKADGVATIRCTSNKYGTVSDAIDVRVAGQDGAYVVEVSVADEQGNSYGNQSIIFNEFDGTTAVQLTARVLYSDGTVKSTAAGDVIDNLTWSVSSTEVVTINEKTGRMKPKADGTAKVQATVSGGLDGDVVGIAYVVVDTGQLERGYNPQDSLKVSVVYESDQDTEVAGKTYDVGSLSALGLQKAAYTQVKADGNWQTLVAEGVPLRTILSDAGVDISSVAALRFKTGDEWVNSPTLSASYVFERAGYYFPNFDAGHLEAGKIPAEPMMAVRSKTHANSTSQDYSDLDEAARFRFCLGSSSATDVTANKSVMYVNTITVVMQGAPPLSPGDGDGGGTGDGGGGTGGGGAGEGGAGTGGGTGDGGGGTGTGGTDEDTTTGTTPNGAAARETVLGATDVVEMPSQAAERSAASQDAPTQDEASQEQSGSAAGNQPADAPGDSRRWQVFEMLSDDTTKLDDTNYSNPLEPFALPLAAALVVAGGVYSNARFRRELKA